MPQTTLNLCGLRQRGFILTAVQVSWRQQSRLSSASDRSGWGISGGSSVRTHLCEDSSLNLLLRPGAFQKKGGGRGSWGPWGALQLSQTLGSKPSHCHFCPCSPTQSKSHGQAQSQCSPRKALARCEERDDKELGPIHNTPSFTEKDETNKFRVPLLD